MKQQLLKLWRDEDGATAIEYALIAGLIAVAIIGVLGTMGEEIKRFFGVISTELEGVDVDEG